MGNTESTDCVNCIHRKKKKKKKKTFKKINFYDIDVTKPPFPCNPPDEPIDVKYDLL